MTLENHRPRLAISVVSPVYHAEACLGEFHRRLSAALSELTDAYEIILVDDGSLDSSWDRIKELARQESRLRGLRLSRNFGQHLAIAAGLAASRGALVIVMDCDLQDPPEMIRNLIEKAGQGYDVVSTMRRSRSASVFRRSASRLFYFLARMLSSPNVRPNSNTLSLISRKVVTAYLRTFDRYSPYPFIVHWLGFRSAVLEIDHGQRVAGSSSYTFSKLVTFAVNALVSQSTRLLQICTVTGLLFSLLSLAQVLYIVHLKLTGATLLLGWASVIAVIWFVGGTILFSLGVIGLYLARMFEQTQNRPPFVIGESTADEAGAASDLLEDSED
jgi:dolichol-phosphate mannosyltransferase